MSEKRFVAIDDDELYYITDTKGLKTLDDYIKEFSKPEYEFTEDEALEHAKEEYWQMIYENSMTATENVDTLNKLDHENFELALELETHKHPLYSTREAERILNEKEEHIRKLHEENKQLKKDIADLEMSIILKNDYIECLKEENEKLKDLQGTGEMI